MYSVIKPKAFTRKESEPYVRQLQEANVKDLCEIYDAIYRDHKDGVEYTLTDEALKAYDSFDEKTCQEINSQWDAGEIASYDGEIGKDVGRYCINNILVGKCVLIQNTKNVLCVIY